MGIWLHRRAKPNSYNNATQHNALDGEKMSKRLRKYR